MKKPRNLEGQEAGSRIGVAILYEDWETGLRAKLACDQVEQAVTPRESFSVGLWRFDLLEEQTVREQAAQAASDANIVMVSAHGQSALPHALVFWLEQWLVQRPDEPTALVVSLDLSTKGSVTANEILALLAEVVEPAGLALFFHFGHPHRRSREPRRMSLVPPRPNRGTAAGRRAEQD